ncbi:MAG TPA: hypothetical protein PLM53_08125 [Spirochaetota bacterium]|nr:hypothetical protein [Spirochaetota bacterium]HQF08064.1 hypothetical protein [Spirochaetota bacterium]HQH97049.1 hypothetical protein [Spirochaetota bacterium]HRS76946.1 hypothetical protein [Spirochaetota bacterium]HRT75907.1 hypothetical protein [Spirochaetota bacterium]
MKKIIVPAIIMTCSVLMAGCAFFQEKGGSDSGSEAISGGDPRELIVGTWKIASVHCNDRGENCEEYKATRFFTYAKDGQLFVNDVKRGTYRVSGNTCLLDTGTTRYTVNIIHVDSTKLITGESHRTTTEIFRRIP